MPYSDKALVKMLKRMSDVELHEDFEDCVLPLITDKAEAAEAVAYVAARRAAPGWTPKMRNGQCSSNHSSVGSLRTRPCETCGEQYVYDRASSRFCSATCRKKAARAHRASR